MGEQSALNPAYWWSIWLLLLTLGGCSNLPLGEKLPAQDPDLTYLGRAPGHPQNTLYRVQGLLFTVFPGVFQPSPDSMALLRHTQIRADEMVLDIGTGTGIQAIFAARVAHRVVATDINPVAVENTRFNAYRLGLADRISVRLSDLFSAIGPQERFDVILFNIEYPNSDADLVLWDVHERFFAQVRRHLKPGGRIYYQFGFRRNMARLQDMLRRNGLQIVAQFQAPAILPGEQYIICVIQPRTPGQQ
ncbi:MAG: methyltransferase [Gammaproteobacteria bacterium]|nr:methyltransferase [Gammaproteobacteria bacterium]MCF6362547.1 methyltransferase [Gammaproteobacteria bacterium]